ncbi:hypothetical protein Agub_g10294, partial [Astrephomene gubernaculifera]
MPQEALIRALLEGQVDARLHRPLWRSSNPLESASSGSGLENSFEKRAAADSEALCDADVRLYGDLRRRAPVPNAGLHRVHHRDHKALINAHGGSEHLDDAASGQAAGELDLHQSLGTVSSGPSARNSAVGDAVRSFSTPGCDCSCCASPDIAEKVLCNDMLGEHGQYTCAGCCCIRRPRVRRNGFLSIRRRRNGFLSIRRRRNGVLASDAVSFDGSGPVAPHAAVPLSALPYLQSFEQGSGSGSFCCANCFRNEGLSDGDADSEEAADGDGLEERPSFLRRAEAGATSTDGGADGHEDRTGDAGGHARRGACMCHRPGCCQRHHHHHLHHHLQHHHHPHHQHQQQHRYQAFASRPSDMHHGGAGSGSAAAHQQGYSRVGGSWRQPGYADQGLQEEEEEEEEEGSREGADMEFKLEEGSEDVRSCDNAWYPRCRGRPYEHLVGQPHMGSRSLSLPVLPNTDPGPYACLGLSPRAAPPQSLQSSEPPAVPPRKPRLLPPSPQLQPLLLPPPPPLQPPSQPPLPPQPALQPHVVGDGHDSAGRSPAPPCLPVTKVLPNAADERSSSSSSLAIGQHSLDDSQAPAHLRAVGTTSGAPRGSRFAVAASSAAPLDLLPAGALHPPAACMHEAPTAAVEATGAPSQPRAADASALLAPPRVRNHTAPPAVAPNGCRRKLLPLANPSWRLQSGGEQGGLGSGPDAGTPISAATSTAAAAAAGPLSYGGASGSYATPHASSCPTGTAPTGGHSIPPEKRGKVLLLPHEPPVDAAASGNRHSDNKPLDEGEDDEDEESLRRPPRRSRSLAALVQGRCLPRLPQHPKQRPRGPARAPDSLLDPSLLPLAEAAGKALSPAGRRSSSGGPSDDNLLRRSVSWVSSGVSKARIRSRECGSLQGLPPPQSRAAAGGAVAAGGGGGG